MRYLTKFGTHVHQMPNADSPVLAIVESGKIIEADETIATRYYDWLICCGETVKLGTGYIGYVKKGIPAVCDYVVCIDSDFLTVDIRNVTHINDGFDSPVGTKRDRKQAKIWTGGWVNVNPFANPYFTAKGQFAFHSGVDLEMCGANDGEWGRGRPIHAVGSGVVIAAGHYDACGLVVAIMHDPDHDGIVVCSRYASLSGVSVEKNARVKRGDKIGIVSPSQRFHLHFDMVRSKILIDNLLHWSEDDKESRHTMKSLHEHYIDPEQWIEHHRP